MSSILSSFDSLLLSECSNEIVAGTMSDVSEVMAVVAVRSIAGVTLPYFSGFLTIGVE